MDIRPEDWHLWNCSSATSSYNKRHSDDLHHGEGACAGKKARKNKGGQSSGSMENNYSMEIGTLKLNIDILPPSLSKTLFRREVGLPRSIQFCPKIDYHLMQLLLASRSPVGKVPMEPVTHSVPKVSTTASCRLLNPFNPTRKWFRTRNETGEQKFEFVDEYIMVKDRACNTRRFMLPSDSLLHVPFTLKYLIADNDKTKLKWRDTDVRYINMYNPEMTSGPTVVKLPNTLMVLEPLKLVAYDLNTGKKLDEVSLSFVGGPTHYSTVHVDEKLDDQIIVSANTVSVKKSNPEMAMELLILSYPKLRISRRLLIPKSGDFGDLDDISMFQDLVLLSKPGRVELFNLHELIDINRISMVNSSTNNQCLETVRLTTKPQPLSTFKSKSAYFLHISAMYPPHVCIKTNNTYEVRSLENPEQVVVSLPCKTHEGDVTVWNYDDQRSRILVSGLLHGFDIFSLDSSNLEILFTTKGFARSDAASEGSDQVGSSSRRNGMRQLEKRNYADVESSRNFGFAYDRDLDLLAVCMVEDGILHSTIYENKTFRPFRKLVPVKLVTPKRVGTLLGCSNIALVFYEGHLSARLDLFFSGIGGSFQELYTVNLLGEVVPED